METPTGVPWDGSQSYFSCPTGSPPQEAQGMSPNSTKQRTRGGVQGQEGRSCWPSLSVSLPVRPQICPLGSHQRPLPSPDWPHFTRLPTPPHLSLDYVSVILTNGSTMHGSLDRPTPWTEPSVSSWSFTAPCTGGHKGGWSKRVGRAEG